MKRILLPQLVHVLAAATLLVCGSASAERPQPQPIGTYARLLKLLKAHQAQASGGVSPQGQTISGGTTGVTALAATAEPTSFSTTLVQVAGVNEADQVKNDGKYIYQLNQNRVLIIRACPDSELGLASSLDFTQCSFTAQGLFLDSRFLVVVGTATREPIARPLWRKWARRFPFLRTSTVQAKVYDITQPDQPRKVRELEIDGDYVGARKIGSTLYLLSRLYPLCYALNFQTTASLTCSTPGFRDSGHDRGFRTLSPQDCYYLPGFYDPSFLVVAAVDLDNAFAGLKVTACLGAGNTLYASPENLYVTTSSRPFVLPASGPITPAVVMPGGAGTASGTAIAMPSLVIQLFTPDTDIYKFSLAGGQPRFVAATTVPGAVLNSYAMDECNGYLRVATTCTGWHGGPTNQLSVLDAQLNLTSKLENIAPGERIYAARFLSNRLFLVTFKQIDPLFAIDLSDPAQPMLAGQLTLPGFSTFLLPYDENHLIGLGKDVIPGSMYQQGLKLALFDVSNLCQPTLVSAASIGDRGTDSPALQDPHALLFDRERNLLAFPLTVAQVTNSVPTSPWQYGTTVFQGAYAFTVSPEAGFTFRGSVTHELENGDASSAGNHQVSRVLAIGSDLFTLSAAQVRANDLETLAPKAVLKLP